MASGVARTATLRSLAVGNRLRSSPNASRDIGSPTQMFAERQQIGDIVDVVVERWGCQHE